MHTYTVGQTWGGAKSLPSRMQRADLLYNHTRSGLAVALQGTKEYHQLLNTIWCKIAAGLCRHEQNLHEPLL